MSDTAVRAVSLGTKIKQCTGLAGTSSVSRETNEFLEEIEAATHDGRDTSKLKAHEVVRIERIWDVYFA